jgi:hypothetical protein
MKNDYTNNKFKELLDKLQQESWQLELLISGFAIFGLISSLEPLNKGLNEAIALENRYSSFLYDIALISCFVLIVNLIIHVVLRGLWIGAIGLRYVSGEIDYDSLKYKKRFTNHLKKKVGSFDKYIGTLENYCSILFAVTFLSLFYIISFFIILLVLLLAGTFFTKSGFFSEYLGFFLLGMFGVFFLLLSLIIFIDFITQGFLKKKEWTSFLYLPLYKFFSVITLSFLYRPLVYNFLDNKFGRKLILILTPVYIFAFFLTTLNNVRSNYISKKKHSSIHYSNTNNYFNSLESNQYVRNAAIQSKIITNNYLKVFIPFREKMEDLILEQNIDLKPTKDKRGFSSDFFLFKTKNQEKDSVILTYIKAFQKTYILKIDSTKITSDFVVSEMNKQLGFETVLSLNKITEGKHILNLNRFVFSKKTKQLEKEDVINIPFWYFKQ